MQKKNPYLYGQTKTNNNFSLNCDNLREENDSDRILDTLDVIVSDQSKPQIYSFN
jgi:hypothetical protein